jgi:fructuronate reductase
VSQRQPLSRRTGDGWPAAPIGQVHLGLGNFCRAHQAVYTEHSHDHDDWGIAAFTGRSAALAETLSRQDGLYTLVTRSESDDKFDLVSSLSACHPADDHDAFLAYLASPQVRVLTLTVTEAGYHGSVPARLVAGLAARRAAGAGPVAIVPCDNLPDNGAVTARVVQRFAEQLDPGLATWIGESVSFVTTVVDRITPRLDPADRELVAARTGRDDHAPVVTEPFSEWILSGDFPGGRPAWEDSGATFTDDITGFEQRKLWLLNGGHCLLAYAGSLRGDHTVAEAVADETCRAWLEQWWQDASHQLDLPEEDIAAYRASLLTRFANRRIGYPLAQVAGDGSLKLPIRVLPVVRAERRLGRLPLGGLWILAGWLCHLRGAGVAVSDPRAAELTRLARGPLDGATRRVMRSLDPELGDDDGAVAAIAALAQELCGS